MTTPKTAKICEGVNFNFISDEKFKTTRVSFNIFLPLNIQTVSKYAILPAILVRSCKKYPSFTELNRQLEELYGAAIYQSVSKLGDVQVLSISAVGINDKFSLDNKPIMSEITELLCDVIFNPLLENNVFKLEDFNQEKRQLIETIEAEFNDKKTYAHNRCEEIMCKNEKAGINKFGTIELANELTPKDVTAAWREILESARIEITMIGNSSHDLVYEKFQKNFLNIQRKNVVKCENEIIRKCEKIHEFSETMDVQQCKLVMGFRTGLALPEKEVPHMILMCALYGGTPSSKLFLNVREKLSLCYYCFSSYTQIKGIMYVECGVEQKNIKKAQDEILKQLKEVKIGNFTEIELSEIKMAAIQSITKIKDNLTALDVWYTGQALCDRAKSPEEAIKEIESVTKEQVIEAANLVTLDTIYVLKGSEN